MDSQDGTPTKAASRTYVRTTRYDRPIVSTTSIPPTARSMPKRADLQTVLKGVNFGRRSPGLGGQNCTPKHSGGAVSQPLHRFHGEAFPRASGEGPQFCLGRHLDEDVPAFEGVAGEGEASRRALNFRGALFKQPGPALFTALRNSPVPSNRGIPSAIASVEAM